MNSPGFHRYCGIYSSDDTEVTRKKGKKEEAVFLYNSTYIGLYSICNQPQDFTGISPWDIFFLHYIIKVFFFGTIIRYEIK